MEGAQRALRVLVPLVGLVWFGSSMTEFLWQSKSGRAAATPTQEAFHTQLNALVETAHLTLASG